MTEEIYNPIRFANTYDKRIRILDSTQADSGTDFLHSMLRNLWSNPNEVSVMPVSLGGDDLGNRVCDGTYIPNPIRMSHTGPGNVYLPEAYCKVAPDYDRIMLPGNKILPVAVVDAVIESQGTAKGIMNVINNEVVRRNTELGTKYSFPDYYFFTLITKIAESEIIQIPNLIAAYWVHKLIWVNGRGPDNNGKGREELDIMGMLSPFANGVIPEQPYYKKLF